MMMTQLKLIRPEPNGVRAEAVVWLPSDKRLKKGNSVRLKGETQWWVIDEVWAQMERHSIHDDWEVGGLGRRDSCF